MLQPPKLLEKPTDLRMKVIIAIMLNDELWEINMVGADQLAGSR